MLIPLPICVVDAHVGKALFHDAILGALRNQGKTVIFVTHALHFLSQCDYIYTMRDGHIEEMGTFQELIAAKGEFARLDKEFNGGDNEQQHESQDVAISKDQTKVRFVSATRLAAGTGKLEGKLIVKEHRSTGSISRAGNCQSLTVPPVTYPTLVIVSVQGLSLGWTWLCPGSTCRCDHFSNARKPTSQFVYSSMVARKVSHLYRFQFIC